MFLVSRLFRWIGVNGALLVLPVIALIGYGLVAFLPIFGLLRVVKTLENSGNYSVMNTARQALFLPLPTIGKYEGKIATDTFFWRFGDLIPAAIVFVGLNWFDFGTQEFALVNIGLSLAWLAVAVQLAKRTPERAPDRDAPAARRAAGSRAFVPRFPTLALASRASSWLAVALGLVALVSSAPADAAADGAAPASSPGLFDDSEPLAMELLFDSKALCRNPQREACVDLPATLLYRDASGEEQRVAVALRTRGRYRADTVQCGLPALFVFFTGDTHSTLFAGESMLPLTTHCARTTHYEQYLLKEYLAYRIYNALTSKSLRVRLVRVTYRDSAGRSEPLERYAFFTEHFESFARRHDVTVRPKQPFDPRSGDAMEIATLDLFEYAIGNTDWSAVEGHNMLLVESATGLVTPVPYDFDFSGLVDAEYASVSPKLGTSSVRQRVFRGVCRPDTDWDAAFAHFAARHDAVLRLVDEIPDLQPRAACRRHRLRRELIRDVRVSGTPGHGNHRGVPRGGASLMCGNGGSTAERVRRPRRLVGPVGLEPTTKGFTLPAVSDGSGLSLHPSSCLGWGAGRSRLSLRALKLSGSLCTVRRCTAGLAQDCRRLAALRFP